MYKYKKYVYGEVFGEIDRYKAWFWSKEDTISFLWIDMSIER